MIYTLTTEFTRLNEISGTVQNSSYVYSLELSDTADPNTGIVIYPLNQLSFSGQKFLRCIDGSAEARVVSFNGAASAGSSTNYDNPDALAEDIWNDTSDDSLPEDDPFVEDIQNILG